MTENRNVYLNGKRMLQKSEGTKLQLIRKRYFESDFDIYPWKFLVTLKSPLLLIFDLFLK